MSMKASIGNTLSQIGVLSSVDLLDVTYCDDLIICSDSEVWTYLVIAGENFGITTFRKLEQHAEDIDTIFANITDVPIHMRLVTMPFDSQAWLKMMLEHQEQESASTGVPVAPIYNTFMRAQADTLRLQGAKTFRRYIGVYLGRRHPKSSQRWGEGTPLAWASRQWDKVFGSADAEPTAEELEHYHKQAKQMRERFISSSRLRARGASAQDMWDLYYHCLNLGINRPAPTLYGKQWGANEASSMTSVVDTTDPAAMKITMRNPQIHQDRQAWQKLTAQGVEVPEPSPILESHVVGMSVELPKKGIPAMWVEQLKELGIPVDISFRFIVKSSQKAEDDAKKANRKINQESDYQSDTSGSLSNELLRLKEESKQHSYDVANDQTAPLITLTTRVFAHAETRDKAIEYSEEIINLMRESMRTNLNPLFGASYDYWRESFPAQKALRDAKLTDHHTTHTDIGALTMSGVFTTVEVGHKHGFYVGSYGSTPVFFDPTLLGKKGHAPATFFNGSLGSGKTVASLQLLDLCRIRNYFTVIIDPKRDQLANLALHGRGHVKLWSLNTEGKPGMLDPFTLISREPNPADPDRDTADKAYDLWRSETFSLVEMAISEMLESSMTENQRARLNDLIRLELSTENPSMHSLMERMRRGELGKSEEELYADSGSEAYQAMRREMSNLHSNLQSAAEDSIGRLVFGKRTENVQLHYSGVNTILINTNGLTLPTEGQAASGYRERASSMVYGLLATYVGNLLINSKSIKGFKVLVVDEFNVARDNVAFQSQIKRIVSMGRSLMITPFLLDQSTASANDEKLFGNKLGGRWVGRSDERSRKAVATALGYANRPDEFEALVAAMPDVMRDRPGRALISLPPDDDTGNINNVKVIQFDIGWNPEYTAFLSNNDGQSRDERASMQQYPTDTNGIWQDPYSPVLESTVAVVEPEPAAEPAAETVTVQEDAWV